MRVDLRGGQGGLEVGLGVGVQHYFMGRGVDVEIGRKEGRFGCHIGCRAWVWSPLVAPPSRKIAWPGTIQRCLDMVLLHNVYSSGLAWV